MAPQDGLKSRVASCHGPATFRRRIARSAEVRLTGIEASSLAGVRAALTDAELPAHPKDWLAADLSLGSWSYHHLAMTLRAQLGLASGENRAKAPEFPTSTGHGGRMRDASLIGELVDAESRGNTGIIAALDHIQDIGAALADGPPRSVLIFAPRFGIRWRQDDIASLRFLACAVQTTSARLVLIAPDRSNAGLPGDFNIRWVKTPAAPAPPDAPPPLAAFIPSVIEKELGAQIGLADIPPSLVASLPNGAALIDPMLRVRPTAQFRHFFDRLGAIETLDPALRAFAQLNGSGYHADPGFLVRQSWRSFTGGGHEIALDLMRHAVACAPDAISRGTFLYELQGMRIALQKFKEAREVEAPDPSLPLETRAGILLTKGWGATLSGHPQEGRAHLSTALDMLQDRIGGGSQFLYLKNIYALSLVRTGSWKEALRHEKEIEVALNHTQDETGLRDWPMIYVNALNQARLFKYHKDFDRSCAYYQRGFATTLGARSESDAVYANFCLAKLYDQQGDDQSAFLCWFRAALHWAAAEVPEALAMRVASGILERQVTPYERVVDNISDVLGKALAAAAARVGINPANDAAPLVFTREDFHKTPKTSALVGAKGWAVILTPDPGIGIALAGPSHDRLRILLSGLIRRAAPETVPTERCVALLPCAATGEMPLSKGAALLTAAQTGIRAVVFDAQHIPVTPEDAARICTGREIRHGPAVGGWQYKEKGDICVFFKRNRHPIQLTGHRAKVFSDASQGIAHKRLATNSARATAIQQLEEAGILISISP